jgi:hypothetical protein
LLEIASRGKAALSDLPLAKQHAQQKSRSHCALTFQATIVFLMRLP